MESVSNIPTILGSLIGLLCLVSSCIHKRGSISLSVEHCHLSCPQHALYRRVASPLSRVPGPEISNWTDLVYIYYWLNGQIPLYVHQLHEKYGQ